jgi:hypothetical protein
MFLEKGGTDNLHFVKVDDLAAWRLNGKAVEGKIQASKIGGGEWNFAVGEGAELFDKLNKMPMKLGDVAERIFQGLVTGADPVFIIQNRKSGIYYSEATKAEHKIENELMHPLCKGSVNLKRYSITDITKSILFPYTLVNGKAIFISQSEMEEKFPKAWAYLKQNKPRLESREDGKWKHERWYAFGRSQNLSEMEQCKIMTPSIAEHASYTLDIQDNCYFVGSGGGGGGGYGITLKPDTNMKYEYLLGLMNSKLLDTYLKRISSSFRGGYYAYNRQYIEQLPIRTIDFSNKEDVAKHDKMVKLVERMLKLHKDLKEASNVNAERVEREINATDREIDALVYELYGLTQDEIGIVEGG